MLQLKQLAMLPFELMATVKNTTPRVGCAESGVRSSGLNPGRPLSSSAFLRAGGARKDNSRTKNGNLGRYGKNALHDMSPGILGDAPMPGNLLALVEPARPARKAD